MKNIFIIPLFFFFLINCFSQQNEVDSLLFLLKITQEDTNKVNILQQLSEVCDEKDMLKYCEEALVLSEKLNYKKGMAIALNNIGYVKANRGKTDEALIFYLKSLAIWEYLDNKKGIATSLNELGYIYNETNQRDKALESYQKSLEIRKKIGDKKDIGYSLNNIGVSYQMHGEQDKALEYFLQSLKIWEASGYKQGISTALNNIGYIYYNQDALIDALKYYQEGLQLQKEIMNTYGIANSLNNIGAVYFKLGDRTKAIQYSKEALQIARENKYPEFMARAAKLLTDIYVRNAEKSLIRNHEDWKKAFEYQQLYTQMKDTLLNKESSKQIAEMQTKYETEKKEQQITLLNKEGELQKSEVRKQKIIIWSVVSGLLLVVILAGFIFKERKKSEKLLLNILPAETARELKLKGKASPKYYESVTVMFTDFKDFTTIAEKLSAEELVSELDFIFKKFDEIIGGNEKLKIQSRLLSGEKSKMNSQQKGGRIEKIKTIGDSYMCAGGIPVSNSTHPLDVVLAALEIKKFMDDYKAKKISEGKPYFEVRIGVHTGPVVAGVVGEKKFAYDIWGDTVNIASRMESSGEAGKVNISGSTYELLKNLTGFQNLTGLSLNFRGKIPAKHKGEIEMYFVERSETPRSGGVERSGTPMKQSEIGVERKIS